MNIFPYSVRVLLFFSCIIGIVFFVSRGVFALPSGSTILSECVDDTKTKIHYHITIEIIFLGEKYALPNNIGIENGCVHPIQMHDGGSNTIHIHSHREYPFTLGDFFTTWGVLFNKDQLGSILAKKRYIISVKVNGKETDQYEHYVVKDGDRIVIAITQKNKVL